MRLAASLEPNNAQILYDLGVSCLGAGLFADAAEACRRAVQIKPAFALGFWRLGVALGHCGEAEAAIDALQKATELQPRLPDAQFRLGMLLEKTGRHREAAARYRNVLTGGPDARLRRLAEARALMMEGRDDEAERKLRRAVAIEPNDAAALSLLGSLLQDAGSFVEAASCFERALSQRGAAQDLAHLYYDLVRCRKVTAQDAVLVQSLRSAVAQLGRAGETGIKLNLALGKALDDLGQYGEAMQRFDAAADIRARVWPVDVAAFERRVDNIIQRFSAEFIESKRSVGNPDPTPVLIFGMPRSGTTLCEQILSSHPMTYGADELPYWDQQGLLMEGAAFSIHDQFIVRGAADCLSLLRQMGETPRGSSTRTPSISSGRG